MNSIGLGGKHLIKKLSIPLAVLAVTVVAAFAATGGAQGSGSKASAGDLTGAGSTFVAKLVQA